MNIFHSSKVFHKKENLPAFELELMPPLLHQCVRLQYGNVLAMLGSHLDISEKSYSSLPTIFLHEYLLLTASLTSHHETIRNAGSGRCQLYIVKLSSVDHLLESVGHHLDVDHHPRLLQLLIRRQIGQKLCRVNEILWWKIVILLQMSRISKP